MKSVYQIVNRMRKDTGRDMMNVSISKELKASIRNHAEVQGVTASQVVEVAVYKYLNTPSADPFATNKPEDFPSM